MNDEPNPLHALRHTALTRLAELAPRHVVQAIERLEEQLALQRAA